MGLFSILCYSKNQRFNILQVMVGYFAYADNTTKRIIENLYYKNILVIYKTIQQALQINMLVIDKKLQTKVCERHFFLFFDNMNFYKYRQDQCLHNNGHQVAYITRYIYFMYSNGDKKVDGNQQQKYLDINQINYSVANKFVAKNFLFNNNNLEHYCYSVYYILSNILSNYFL